MYGNIDRFEGDLAVIYIEDKDCIINLPKILLPADLNEGDYLKINIEFDPDKTKEAWEEVKALFES